MSKDTYRNLAEHLNAMPQGFPKTKSGIEIRILKKIFTKEEAEVASQMKLMPENADQVAERLGREPKEMAELLERMTSKGQLMGMGPKDGRMYSAFPFIAGVHEFQLPRVDREYAELFEQYFEEAYADAVGKEAPSQVRIYPVEQAITAELTVLPFEKVSSMVEKAQAWAVADCICRKEKQILGEGCGATMNNCIAFSADPHGFDIDYRGARKASKEEVLELLKKAEEEGLVHTSWNVQDSHVFVCNCCTCCCLVLRGIKKAPNFAARSNYYAQIDADTCAACGVCADERCPMQAIDARNEHYEVNRERCIGCGVCVVTCPSGALSLVRKDEAEIDIPPDNIVAWTMEKAQKTGRTMEGLI
ncbi:MAG: 4Fe-4S dicluster domain-containing protein [Candidatus Abyssobacteria bacterium SURF_17]|uniref:4Fe-4S dicluster domain-containing protein n=1 Tax=Candidatus Abyssobacteria bacterium SURF_17 TaxID=2093361 RepID=A0A419F627_9BACT|nr:MAG: 4Fe-4S dicluster domain-containing protein [Candidatus Abyssubacteria bacterium SURF_17]